MVTTIGSSAYKVRMGDNSTAGQGTYEVYLNPEFVIENITLVPMAGTEFVADADVSAIQFAGGVDVIVALQQIQLAYNDTTRQNLEKALVYWGKNNTLLYITHAIDSTDWLTWPAYSDLSLATFRGKIKRLIGFACTTTHITINTVEIRRYTA